MSNLKACSIAEVKKICNTMWQSEDAKGIVVNLSGPPGVGKTETFEQLATNWEADYKVFLTSTMDPTDLVGPPHNIDNVYSTFLPPQDFLALTYDCEKLGTGYSVDKPMIAVFEDLPSCHPQVLNALLRIMQQREVCGRKLRDNVYMACTGNRVEDKAGAALIHSALANRMLHLELRVSAAEWCRWATSQQVDPLLVSYIDKQKENALHNFDPNLGDMAFVTPRSVNNANKLIKALGYEDKHLSHALSGICGQAWAGGFLEFIRVKDKIIPLDSILKDPNKAKLPKESDIDIAFMTINNLIYHVTKDTPSVKNIESAIIYMNRFHSEEHAYFGVKRLFGRLIEIEELTQEQQEEISNLKVVDDFTTKFEEIIIAMNNN